MRTSLGLIASVCIAMVVATVGLCLAEEDAGGTTTVINVAPNSPIDLICDATILTPKFSAVHTDNNADNSENAEIWVGTSEGENNMWASGWLDITPVESGARCQNITYEGSGLTREVTYYWKIRFMDDDAAIGEWSVVETFKISRLPMLSVWMPSIEATGWVEAETVRVYGTIYGKGESGTIYAQVIDENGDPVNTATVKLTVWKSDGTRFLDGVSMSFIVASNGIYIYNFTTPDKVGIYLCDVSASWDSVVAYGSGEFQVVSWVEELEAENAVGYLTITVLDNETHEPIEGVKVELYKLGVLVESKYSRWDGKAFLDIMNWGVHELKWSKGGYESEVMEIDLAVSSDLTLRMVPTEEKEWIPDFFQIIVALVIGCVLAVSVHYGSGKKAGKATLFIVFILPILLTIGLRLAGVLG